MSRKNILGFGAPVLREIAKPITVFHKKLDKLIDDMIEILCSKEGGAGMAAPQIGVSKRIVVIQTPDGVQELINPEILNQSGEQTGEEACLSLRGYHGIVKRYNYVKIKALNRKAKEIEFSGEGYLARCIQHEIDHLNGILYIDKITPDQFFNDFTEETASLTDIQTLSRPQS